MSGYIGFASMQVFNIAPFVKQGKLRALGITSLARSPALPDVAAIIEQRLTACENPRQ